MKQTLFPCSFIFTASMFLATPLAVADSQQVRSAPCKDARHHQFDFWIGNWNVTRPDGKLVGTNRVEAIENGCGVQENWRSTTGQTGRSINAWSAQDKQWHQTWLGSGGMLLQLAGGLQNGKMILQGKIRAAHGKLMLQRITWTPMKDGRVRQHWQQSSDNGQKWNTAFDGMYAKADKPVTAVSTARTH